MRKLILASLTISSSVAAQTSAARPRTAPLRGSLEHRLAQLIDAPPFSRATWGIYVVDDRGRVLYQRNADRFSVPASNTKLVVTAAAAVLLPPDYRVTTSLYLNGRVDAAVLQGDLILYGRGDPRPGRVRLELYGHRRDRRFGQGQGDPTHHGQARRRRLLLRAHHDSLRVERVGPHLVVCGARVGTRLPRQQRGLPDRPRGRGRRAAGDRLDTGSRADHVRESRPHGPGRVGLHDRRQLLPDGGRLEHPGGGNVRAREEDARGERRAPRSQSVRRAGARGLARPPRHRGRRGSGEHDRFARLPHGAVLRGAARRLPRSAALGHHLPDSQLESELVLRDAAQDPGAGAEGLVLVVRGAGR